MKFVNKFSFNIFTVIAIGTMTNQVSLANDCTMNTGSASGTGVLSIACGSGADATATGSTAYGASSEATSGRSTVIGYAAKVLPAATNGIAIGGDSSDMDNDGAVSAAPGAIAIGNDIVASTPNTMTVGVPILVDDQNTTVANRSLIKLENNGPAGFKLTDEANATSWSFAQTSYLGFTMDNLNTVGQQEVRFFQGGNVSILGTLTEGSSKSYKKGIKPIDSMSVLDKVSSLPIKEWTYKHEDDDVKHVGPMAEDFHEVFGLGSSPKGIASLDSAGVALASIQALRAEKDAQIDALRSEIKAMRDEMLKMQGR